jgi:hypothetical protein
LEKFNKFLVKRSEKKNIIIDADLRRICLCHAIQLLTPLVPQIQTYIEEMEAGPVVHETKATQLPGDEEEEHKKAKVKTVKGKHVDSIPREAIIKM